MTDEPKCCDADARLARAALEGCEESRLLMSRRAMLGVTAGLFSWAYMPRYAEAATGGARLLVVILRGGMDGINVVVPIGDRHYVSMRGNIAIPANATIRISSLYGLHPSLKNFAAMYRAREAAVVHATCVPLRNRSHFDTQDNLESGLPGMSNATSTGWLNRVLAALPAGAPVKVRGAIEIGDAPLILRGPAPVLAWSPTWFSPVEDPTLWMIRTLYRENDPPMLDVLDRGLRAHRLASRVDRDDGNISALRKSFRGAGRLLAANDGPRIAVLSVGGWDTHADQSGQLTGLLAGLDDALLDFKVALGRAWASTFAVMVTEFGRTVRVNGNSGTDHGVGTVALLAGGAVNGRRVFGDWPGLAPNQLFENSDLRATTDLRSVFKGILRDHIGVAPSLLESAVFPDSRRAVPMAGLVDRSAPDIADSAGETLASIAAKAELPIAKYRRTHGIAHTAAN